MHLMITADGKLMVKWENVKGILSIKDIKSIFWNVLLLVKKGERKLINHSIHGDLLQCLIFYDQFYLVLSPF